MLPQQEEETTAPVCVWIQFSGLSINMTRIAPQNSYLESIEYKSLGFNTLLDFLRADGKHAILDLGQALGVNVDFWSRFPCRIYIEDFHRSYREAIQSAPEAARESLIADLLPIAAGTCFDIILAWDLLNYLNQEELNVLIRCLSRWCRPGTLLFALIAAHAQIPAEPSTFRILDRERMIYEMHTQKTRPSPGYHPKDLARLLMPFEISSSFLLRNGIQEYVFAYKRKAQAS